MMFKDWLLTTRELQKKSFGKDPAKLEGENLVQYIRWNELAAIDELMEALHEVYWKPWTTDDPGFRNRDAFVGELVDVMHFVGNMLVAANCTDEELSLKYAAKQQKNRDRQASGGYQQDKDKCPHCGSAYDDDATKCRRDDGWCVHAAWTQLAAVTESAEDEVWEDAVLGSNVHVDDVVRVRDDAYDGVRGDEYNGQIFDVVAINYGHVEVRRDKSYTLHHPSKLQARKASRR